MAQYTELLLKGNSKLMMKFFTCLASVNKLVGGGDSGLANLADW